MLRLILLPLIVAPTLVADGREQPNHMGPPDATYARLVEDMFDYERVSDARIGRIVSEGISSTDSKIVDATVTAIVAESLAQELQHWTQHIGPASANNGVMVPERGRQLNEVAGLRDHLLESAGKHMRRVDPTIDFGFPLWMGCLTALAVHFPGDPFVHDLLLDSMDDIGDVKGLHNVVLRSLNVGLFDTEAADEIRLNSLQHGSPSIVIHAARGIALTRPKDGLQALVSNLGRRDGALFHIVEAIESYGSDAALYVERLKSLQLELESVGAIVSWQRLRISESISRLSLRSDVEQD